MSQAVIAGAARTPIGSFQGMHHSLDATRLGSAAIGGVLAGGAIPIDQVFMGCVLPAGLGQAPARQAALAAGLSDAVPATTISKVCGSGMQSLIFAVDAIRSTSAVAVVAGGMESMSNAPYLLPKVRAGLRYGHAQLLDHMAFDGLEDAYERGRSMGSFAEDAVAYFGFDRAAQDDYALQSLNRARAATEEGAFTAEIVPTAGTALRDEQPDRVKPEKMDQLKPAFREGGTITAAHSSPISDGAAALLVVEEGLAGREGLPVRARIVGHAAFAGPPQWFTTAPVGAIRRLLDAIDWSIGDVDLFEINEAFAVVAMIAMRELGIDHARLNVHGGACALGHPIGASGARIVVTLLHALERHNLKRGIAAICIGGGEALAVAIERS